MSVKIGDEVDAAMTTKRLEWSAGVAGHVGADEGVVQFWYLRFQGLFYG